MFHHIFYLANFNLVSQHGLPLAWADHVETPNCYEDKALGSDAYCLEYAHFHQQSYVLMYIRCFTFITLKALITTVVVFKNCFISPSNHCYWE